MQRDQVSVCLFFSFLNTHSMESVWKEVVIQVFIFQCQIHGIQFWWKHPFPVFNLSGRDQGIHRENRTGEEMLALVSLPVSVGLDNFGWDLSSLQKCHQAHSDVSKVIAFGIHHAKGQIERICEMWDANWTAQQRNYQGTKKCQGSPFREARVWWFKQTRILWFCSVTSTEHIRKCSPWASDGLIPFLLLSSMSTSNSFLFDLIVMGLATCFCVFLERLNVYRVFITGQCSISTWLRPTAELKWSKFYMCIHFNHW